MKNGEDGAREGAAFITRHLLRGTERAFEDYGQSADAEKNRRLLGSAKDVKRDPLNTQLGRPFMRSIRHCGRAYSFCHPGLDGWRVIYALDIQQKAVLGFHARGTQDRPHATRGPTLLADDFAEISRRHAQ